jgi:hypothetical protein
LRFHSIVGRQDGTGWSSLAAKAVRHIDQKDYAV